MTALLKKIHWILILIACGKLGMTYYEFVESKDTKTQELEQLQNDVRKNEGK